jgi:hypothetical protein
MYGCAHMAGEEHQRILRSIGEVLRADMRGLADAPPPKAILLHVLHLIRREQEQRGPEPISYDELPEELRRLLDQLRSSVK